MLRLLRSLAPLTIAGALLSASTALSHAQGGPSPDGEPRADLGRLHDEWSPATTVITAAEIQVHGYHTLAEALRWVRGLYVADDGTYGYLGMRGVQRPGDFNNKVVIAIDGHNVVGNVYGDGYIGRELGLDLERVDRIEVTHGPGSALHGANAVLAVVNVVTRPPSRSQGLDVTAWTGGLAERRAAVSMDSARPDGPAWSWDASWLDENGLELYQSIEGGPAPSGTGNSGERAAAFLGRLEWKSLRLSGKYNDRRKPTSDVPGDRAYDGHSFVELADSRRLGSSAGMNTRVWWDGARYRSFTADASTVQVDSGTGDVVGGEWRMDWSQGDRSLLTAGVEAQRYARARLLNYQQDPYVVAAKQDLARSLAAAFLQNRYRLGPDLELVAGARLDAWSEFDPIVSPRLQLLWGARDMAAWLYAGSSSRVPTLYEINDRSLQTSAPPLEPERVVSLEASVQRGGGPYRATLSAYRNEIRNLIDLDVVDSLGTAGYTNRDRVIAQGIEGEIRVSREAGPDARLSVAWQTTRDADERVELTNSPRWNVQLVATHAPSDARVSLGGGVRWLSPRQTGDGRTDAALVADARLGLRLWPSTTLGVELKNVFDARTSDPIGHAPVRDPVAQMGRGMFITLRHHLGW